MGGGHSPARMVAGGGIDRGRLAHRHGNFQDENLRFILIKSRSYRCARCQLCTTVHNSAQQCTTVHDGVPQISRM